MPSLAELQESLVAAVLAGGGGGALPEPAGPVPAEVALAIHRGTVFGALANALRLTYPTVLKLVGEDFFDQAAAAYATGRSDVPRLDLYGAGFPRFLADYTPAAGLPYLADAARLDQAIDRALFGADETKRAVYPLDGPVALSLPANLALLRVDFPVDVIRQALDAEDDGALAALEMTAERRCLAVWRSGAQAKVVRLDPSASTFLAVIMTGGAAAGALAATVASAGEDHALAAIKTDVFAAPFARIEARSSPP